MSDGRKMLKRHGGCRRCFAHSLHRAAELDAVEALLMPLVHALLADLSDTQPGKTTPDTTPMPTPTHKRLNELLPEEI
jgi:hypothetical protein